MSSQFGRSTRVAGEEGRDRARIQLALSIMAIIRKDRQGEEREEGSAVLEFTEGEFCTIFIYKPPLKYSCSCEW